MDPRVTADAALLGRGRAARHAARRVRALPAPARARAVRRRLGGAGTCVVLTPEDIADLGLLRLPGQGPARARRRRPPRRRRRRPRSPRPTREQARAAAAQLVDVEYEELPAVTDPLAAVAAGTPLCTSSRAASAKDAVSIDVRPIPAPNVCHRFRIRHGDVADRLRARPTWSSRRSTGPPARRTRRWSRTPRSPSGTDGRLTIVERHADAVQQPRRPRRRCSASTRSRSASSRRRWAARSGPRRSCASRRSSPRWRARRGGR